MFRKSVLCAVSLWLLSGIAMGATGWDGSDSNDWAAVANWDAGVPTSSDLAIIYGDMFPVNMPTIFNGTTANADASVKSL